MFGLGLALLREEGLYLFDTVLVMPKRSVFGRIQIACYLFANYAVLSASFANARVMGPILANWYCPVVTMDLDGILVLLPGYWFLDELYLHRSDKWM